MKKLLLLLLFTTTACLSGCEKSEISPEKNDPGTTVPMPFKIELSSNWPAIYTNLATIKADDKEEIILSAEVTDKNGSVLDKEYKLTLNGKDFNSKSFKTLIPGNYIFQASIGDLKSNEYKVTAEDFADRYVSIESSAINSVSSSGLVKVAIKYKNISNKKLKYIDFFVSCYNRVNDVIEEEIWDTSSITCRATGFFNPNQSETSYWDIGYFTGASSIKVRLRSVTFEDGTAAYGDFVPPK